MMYFGIVENIIDPQNAGRVQVRVFPYYREFAVEDLPWAYVLRSTDLGNTGGMGLNMHNLIEGTQVLVDFLDNQMQQPIVLGIVPREKDFADLQSYVKHMIKFTNGTEIIVDETPDKEYIKIIDTKKNYILMNDDGIEIHVGEKIDKVSRKTKKINIFSKGDVEITSEGDTKINSTGETTIEASKLTLSNITGMNQLCCLKNCLFTGSPHQSPTSD